MPRVTRTQQADNDLDDLMVGLSRFSNAAATRARAAIDRAAKLLARSPRLGRPRPDLRSEMLSYAVAGKYVIYYRIIPNGIELVRELHGARDVAPSMFDD